MAGWLAKLNQIQVNVKAEASGVTKVSIPTSGLEICPDNGYLAQLVTAEVDVRPARVPQIAGRGIVAFLFLLGSADDA